MTRHHAPTPDRDQPAGSGLPAPCRATRRRATDFLDGRLAAAAREPVQRHLRDCPACRVFFREMFDLGALARRSASTLPAPRPTTTTAKVLEEARRRRLEVLSGLDDGLPPRDAAAGPTPRQRFATPPRTAAAAAAVALLVLGAATGGFAIGRWSAPVPAGPSQEFEPASVGPRLPGDPHRLRRRDEDAPVSGPLVEPAQDADATRPSPDREPHPLHILTNDR